jgi:hypothetical protein
MPGGGAAGLGGASVTALGAGEMVESGRDHRRVEHRFHSGALALGEP